MAGFDDLIEHLLNSVALSGNQGLDAAKFKDAVTRFYREKESTRTADEDENDNVFSDSPPEHHMNVDDAFIETVYKWLSDHPDIDVRHTPSSKDSSAAATDNDHALSRLAGKRLFTTEDRTWYAVAGHGVDHTRIPKLDFDILTVIASHGPGGVLQPTVSRLTGQDKRSVPHRTDRLAQSGYIIKETVIGAGTKTSFLKLARLAHHGSRHKIPTQQPGMRKEEGPIVYHDRWFDILLRLFKENNDVVTIFDLWLALEIKVRPEKKQLQRCLRRLVEVTCVRRVTARLLGDDGQPITRLNSGEERRAQAIQLLREPTELDRHVWLKDSALPSRDQRSSDSDGEGVSDVDDAVLDSELDAPADVEDEPASAGGAAEHVQHLASNDDEVNDLDLIKDRVPPQWRPDVPLPNLIHGIVQSAGEDGIKSTDLARRVAGSFWRRPMDETTAHLTDEDSQPPHLRHLTLLRSTENGKQAHYRYRTIDNVEKATQDSDLSSAVLAFDQDGWGFPSVPLKELAGRDGRATLAEGRKGATVEGIQHDDYYSLQPASPGLESTQRVSRPGFVQKSKATAARKPPKNKANSRLKVSGPTTVASPSQMTPKRRVRPRKDRLAVPQVDGSLDANTSSQIAMAGQAAADRPLETERLVEELPELPAPARVPQGPYGMRQRLSSTVVPEALLESTPETEFTARDSTPLPVGTEKRKYTRKSLPGQPDVPVGRTHETKPEEYEEFDKWAQKTAELQVMKEVRSVRKLAGRSTQTNQSEIPEDPSHPSLSSTSEVQEGEVANNVDDLPEDRVAEVKAQILSKKEPGIYMNPPGARKMKAESFIQRGRPRNALIAVAKSDRLHEFDWFQADKTPRFAPKASRRRTATIGRKLAVSAEFVHSDSEGEERPPKRQRRQSTKKLSGGDSESVFVGSPVIANTQAERVQLSRPVDVQVPTASRQTVDQTANVPEHNAKFIHYRAQESPRQNGAPGNVQQSIRSSDVQSMPHVQQKNTPQDTVAVRERLRQLFSKPGRKSQATTAEITRLQKKLATAELSSSKHSALVVGRGIMAQSPNPRDAIQPKVTGPGQHAIDASSQGPLGSHMSPTSTNAVEELATLHSTPGRKTHDMLKRAVFLEQELKKQQGSQSGQRNALLAELQELRNELGRKDLAKLSRMVEIEQTVERNDTSEAPHASHSPTVISNGNAASRSPATLDTHLLKEQLPISQDGDHQRTPDGPNSHDIVPVQLFAPRQQQRMIEKEVVWRSLSTPDQVKAKQNGLGRHVRPSADLDDSMEVDQEVQGTPKDSSTPGLVVNPDTATPTAKSKHGSASANERRETILGALDQCGGVFPGEHEMWYVCVTAWREAHGGQTPARVTTDRAIQLLLNEGKLKKLQFSIAAKGGGHMTKYLLARPDMDAKSPVVLETQKQMTLAYPKLYLPPEVHISNELRNEATNKWTREKKPSLPSPVIADGQTTLEPMQAPLGPQPAPSDSQQVVPETPRAQKRSQPLPPMVSVQQSPASAALDDRKAQLKGFPDAKAHRLHTQQLYRQSKSSSSKKRRVSAVSSDEDDDNDDTDAFVDVEQQVPQGGAQVDKGAFKPRSKASRPTRNLRRPLGSLHTTRNNQPRRKWWEDSGQLLKPAASLLMSPAQVFDPRSGTFSTSGLASVTDSSSSRTVRGRTLALEDAAWNQMSSQDWTNIVQRANGLGPTSKLDNYERTVSSVVTLKAPGNRIAEITSTLPQPGRFPGVQIPGEQVSPLVDSTLETPPAGPEQRRRYKSRAKKKVKFGHDETPESDEEFVPGAVSPKGDLLVGTPGRTRVARGSKDIITRDRHSGPSFKDSDRLVVALAIVSAVCGGINQERLNWGLVAHALSFRYEAEFLRRRWTLFVRYRKPDVDALRNAILEPFLEAYEKDKLPRVNFQDLGNTDWPGLFQWASDSIPLVKHVGTIGVPDLPASRKSIARDYNFAERADLYDQDKDLYFTCNVDTKRRELAIKYVNGSALPGHTLPGDGRQEDMLLAKSWIRAVAMTKQFKYLSEEAARKVSVLGAKTIAKASAELVESRIFVQEKKGRQLPGRNFLIHHEVVAQFKRWPSTDESGHLNIIAQIWAKLNDYFKHQDHLQLVPVANDAEYLVLTNMCAQGFLRVKPILPERTDDFETQGPKLSAWGYAGYGYETKKVKQDILKYDLVYSKLSGYKYMPELNPDVPIPTEPAMVQGEMGPRIPLWIDIHGNLIEDAWDMVLRSILHLLVYRPGAKPYHMEVAHNHKFWAWEIEMVLLWMEKVGVAKRCGSGKEVDGVWKGGWRAGGWWYCLFLPNIAKWRMPVEGQ